MGSEIAFLSKYPRAERDPAARAAEKTPEDIAIAREFGRDFFDGERRHGYGGYRWSPERWHYVVADMLGHYKPDSVLDVGCAKGYMLLEFLLQDPHLTVAGVDVSTYAIRSAPTMVKHALQWSRADYLPYETGEFDLAISINTLHNLERDDISEALLEMSRVSRAQYVTVDAYRTDEERKRVFDWNLTARTILHVDEWLELFEEAGYTGDYGWWLP
jgi:SAM-dependent methyltransferase